MKVSPIDYRARHEELAAELGGGALLLLSQPSAYRNSTVANAWRQDSFFHFLTGFEEPESAFLYLSHRPKGERAHLFLCEKDPVRELWEGRRLGLSEAKKRLPVDEVHPITSLWEKVPQLLGAATKLYAPLGMSEDYDRNIIQVLTRHKAAHGKKNLACKLPVFDADYAAGRLRLRKRPDEVERMRAAADVTRKTFAKIYQTVRPGMNERDVHGLILGEFLRNGGEMESYGSIVAGGVNACVLHYRENNAPLNDGELLLIDAGAQYGYYASDVTRTFPIGKRFSPEQRALYDIVLEAQKASIAKAVPGSSLTAVHDATVERLTEGLIDLGFLKGSKQEIIETLSYKRYFAHGTSHWIGMDVHDVGVYSHEGQPVKLEPGMYFSVEPGLYVDPSDELVPERFRGIGIRIEDDVLVTAGGYDVVTTGIAKEVAELENRY